MNSESNEFLTTAAENSFQNGLAPLPPHINMYLNPGLFWFSAACPLRLLLLVKAAPPTRCRDCAADGVFLARFAVALLVRSFGHGIRSARPIRISHSYHRSSVRSFFQLIAMFSLDVESRIRFHRWPGELRRGANVCLVDCRVFGIGGFQSLIGPGEESTSSLFGGEFRLRRAKCCVSRTAVVILDGEC